ncbi:MAG: hypothetical protein R3E77_09145 [Steroidobacteraceae bacterium]
MTERDADSFDMDSDFDNDGPEEGRSVEALLERPERRARHAPVRASARAAWARIEDVLADRKLANDLKDVFEDDV